jgi:hypothetical protein
VQIEQRKQQEHNGGRDWKGQSQELDVTPHLDIGERNRIQICCFDDQPFAYALVCCKYRSSASLFRTLTDPTSKERIARLERNACIAKAKGIANQQLAESVESDVEVDESDRKFVISLTCPNSKLPMTTPVRGKLCNHFQVSDHCFIKYRASCERLNSRFSLVVKCFDLDYFVRMNIRVSGTRWRCSPCDQFVSLESLEVCELTAGLLKEFKNVLSRTRDRVEVKADGSYVLLEERRERSKKRLNGAEKVDLQSRTTTTAADPPVYELL